MPRVGRVLIMGILLMPCLAPAALGLVECARIGGNGESQGILLFSCFLTLLNATKCLEIGETTKSLEKIIYSRDFVVSHVS